jgi:hypothetical protein
MDVDDFGHDPKSISQDKRIRWCFRISAIPFDPLRVEPDEVEPDREEEAKELLAILSPHCQRVVFQLESAPTTGYLHHQGYFELINKKAKTWILNNIFKPQYLKLAIAKKPIQSWNYCTKNETRLAGPWIFGTPPSTEDLPKPTELFVRDIQAGMKDEDLWDQHASAMARLEKVPDRIRSLKKPNREEIGPLKVWVFFGGAGVGKSWNARALFPDIYDIPISDSGKLWFTTRGSNAREILLEDFDGATSKLPLKVFNRLLDPYPMEVEKKNGHIWYCPAVLVITTNVPPSQWYNYDSRQDVKRQVFRRITAVYDFNTQAGLDLMEQLTCEQLDVRYPIQRSTVAPIRQGLSVDVGRLRLDQDVMDLDE